jgi:hypothetical protein
MKLAAVLGLAAIAAGIVVERQTANGVVLPENARVVTFKVWCYTAGQKALTGQPGVLDIVKSVRSRPFGEWNVVYFDPSKTDAAALLQRLRENGCKNATRVETPAVELDGVTIMLSNPIVVPGDVVQLEATPSGSRTATIHLVVPDGWRTVSPIELGHGNVASIQTPADAKSGKCVLTVRIAGNDQTAREAQLEVELVERVK